MADVGAAAVVRQQVMMKSSARMCVESFPKRANSVARLPKAQLNSTDLRFARKHNFQERSHP